MLIMGVGFFVGGLVVVFCYVFFCDFFFFLTAAGLKGL